MGSRSCAARFLRAVFFLPPRLAGAALALPRRRALLRRRERFARFDADAVALEALDDAPDLLVGEDRRPSGRDRQIIHAREILEFARAVIAPSRSGAAAIAP